MAEILQLKKRLQKKKLIWMSIFVFVVVVLKAELELSARNSVRILVESKNLVSFLKMSLSRVRWVSSKHS